MSKQEPQTQPRPEVLLKKVLTILLELLDLPNPKVLLKKFLELLIKPSLKPETTPKPEMKPKLEGGDEPEDEAEAEAERITSEEVITGDTLSLTMRPSL
jgi:hypothetical protein